MGRRKNKPRFRKNDHKVVATTISIPSAVAKEPSSGATNIALKIAAIAAFVLGTTKSIVEKTLGDNWTIRIFAIAICLFAAGKSYEFLQRKQNLSKITKSLLGVLFIAIFVCVIGGAEVIISRISELNDGIVFEGSGTAFTLDLGGSAGFGFQLADLERKSYSSADASIHIQDLPPFQLEMRNKRVFMNISFRTQSGQAIRLEHNKLTIDSPDLDENQNEGAVEIISGGEPIFQLIRVSPTHLQLNGVFRGEDGLITYLTPAYTCIGQKSVDPNVKIPLLFKYPAYRHRGEWADSK